MSPTDRAVFLSYAPPDHDRVIPLVRALEREGWSPVWDRSAAAIDRSRAVIALWSTASVGSDSVQAEAEHGRKRRALVPALLDDVQPPPAFRSMSAANLIGWRGGEHPEVNALIGAATLLARPPHSPGTASPEPQRVPAGLLNSARGELNIKIAYGGPASAARTRSLMQLYEKASAKHRGKLITLRTEPEPAICFDFAPPDLGMVRGFDIRLHLYGVPAEDDFEQTRRLILKNAAGVVFVADLATADIESNLAALQRLRGTLGTLGIDDGDMPLVFQYDNDRPDHPAFARLRAQLNQRGAPEIVSVATQGVGVSECLRTVARIVLLRSNYPEVAPLLPMPIAR